MYNVLNLHFLNINFQIKFLFYMSKIRVYYGTIIITYRNSQCLHGTRSLFYSYE